jgi:predicted lipase
MTYAFKGISLAQYSYYGEYGTPDIGFLTGPIEKFNYHSDGTHVEGFIGFENDTMYIVFQGSNGKHDWLSNFNFCKRKIVPYDNKESDIRIHSGFINQYKIARTFLHISVNQYNEFKNINVVGHSLGGALAVLCGVDLQYNFSDRNISVYTFGCPRVGNRAFIESYITRVPRSYHFKNRLKGDNDIVTTVPFELFGYTDFERIQVSGEPQETDKRWYVFFDKIRAHYPDGYRVGVMSMS